MYLESFKEVVGSDLYCDSLPASDQNHHLGKVINNHKNKVISPLGVWKA
jgi:hypothetical protein